MLTVEEARVRAARLREIMRDSDYSDPRPEKGALKRSLHGEFSDGVRALREGGYPAVLDEPTLAEFVEEAPATTTEGSDYDG